MRISRHVAGGAVAVLMAMAFSVVPAHATVHEIVAQWCSGHEPQAGGRQLQMKGRIQIAVGR